MNSKVAIVILNYKQWEDTVECVKSLLKHIEYPNYEIIIVDNKSPNDSFEKLKLFIESITTEKVHLIQNTANNGFANGNNLGIKAGLDINAGFFWLLNNDTIIQNDALTPLVQCYKDEEVGILGSKLRFYDERDTLQAIGATFNPFISKIKQIGFNEIDTGQYDHVNIDLDFVVGASLFVDRTFINKVGFVSEDYFLYFEELDWSLRAKSRGLKTKVCLDSIVYHKQGSTTKNRVRGKKNIMALNFQFKNLLLIYRKYFIFLYPVAVIIVFMRILKLVLTQGIGFSKLLIDVFFSKRRYSFEN